MAHEHTPVLINLLATARYDRMPEVPIQFITVGKLLYRSPEDAQIQYVESQQDEETGEIMNSDIRLIFSGDKITIQRDGDFSNTMVFSNGKRFEGVYHTPYGELDMAVYTREAACRIGSGSFRFSLRIAAACAAGSWQGGLARGICYSLPAPRAASQSSRWREKITSS